MTTGLQNNMQWSWLLMILVSEILRHVYDFLVFVNLDRSQLQFNILTYFSVLFFIGLQQLFQNSLLLPDSFSWLSFPFSTKYFVKLSWCSYIFMVFLKMVSKTISVVIRPVAWNFTPFSCNIFCIVPWTGIWDGQGTCFDFIKYVQCCHDHLSTRLAPSGGHV